MSNYILQGRAFALVAGLLFVSVLTTSCGNTEDILPRRDGTWDLAKVTTEKLNGSGAVDSIITQSNVAVITFSPEGAGSLRNNSDNSLAVISWASYEGNGSNEEFVELSYVDHTGDSLSYLFTVIESKGSEQQWEALYVDTKTGFSSIVNWELRRAK